MADSTPNLEQLEDGQPLNRRTVNSLASAMSPASYWARHDEASDPLGDGFIWGYYGGVINGTRYGNGTLDLSAYPSTTVYIGHSMQGVPVASSSALADDLKTDYIAVTNADGVSSYQDVRCDLPFIGKWNPVTRQVLLTMPDGSQIFLGPSDSP